MEGGVGGINFSVDNAATKYSTSTTLVAIKIRNHMKFCSNLALSFSTSVILPNGISY